MSNKKRKADDARVLTIRHQQEKDDLERNMTLKRDKKKESLTKKLLEHERSASRTFFSHFILQSSPLYTRTYILFHNFL